MLESFFFGGGFEILFFLVFAIVIFTFLAVIVKGILQWSKNNHSPRLTVEATIVSRRMRVHEHHHSETTGIDRISTQTTYYVTFQVASGDRMELQVSGSEYGMLAEGDRGSLTFQGTRYLSFVRQ